MKVKLREKKISDGRKSLYLDFYPPIIKPDTGKQTRREFLGLYTFDCPHNEPEKEHNKATKALGESIRAKRQIDVDAGQFGFLDRAKKKQDFLAFFQSLAEERKESKSNHENWLSVLKYLEKYTGGKCTFGDIDEKFVEGFRDFLLTTKNFRNERTKLSQNTAHSYFNKFKAALNHAFEKKILSDNSAMHVKGIKQAETQREFLTLEELQALAKTDCEIPEMKKAALFMALTGLRWSDIEKLVWGEVFESDAAGAFIRFTQKKTKGKETLPISEQAFELLGERSEPNEKVFKVLTYSAWLNMKLQQWITKAGISKHITFHCFRHTYATLQLTLGTDIYTVSKMLGHKEVKTTQIYAKIIDQKKQEAANRIKLEF